MSDRIAVLRDGRVEQVGAPEALYRAPDTAFVARFLGGANIVADPVLAERLAGEPAPAGHALAVRPEHLLPTSEAGVEARLLARQFLGQTAELMLEAGTERLRAWVPPDAPVPSPLRLRAAAYRWVRLESASRA